MHESTGVTSEKATQERAEAEVDAALDWLRPRLLSVVLRFLSGDIGPVTFWEFERNLWLLVRDFGRCLLERLLNGIEGDGGLLAHDVLYDGQGYRRLGKKTRNAFVATLFGTICLWRFPYRFWDSRIPQRCIFPLELHLGLLEGVTPALADYLGRALAETGASQRRVLRQLREQHGVAMGVKRLRKFLRQTSTRLAEYRAVKQVEKLLDALRVANASSGSRKPVLAVGRDGTTICEHLHSFWQVATTATITVFDRRGQRITTVYLAWRPEFGQATLSQMLTDLLNETLHRWEAPLPTLAYIADSGGNETSYFDQTLKQMLHPRTGERLDWQRVVDFYHTTTRVWTMAECLFGENISQRDKWAKRMLHILKQQPRGAKRVLHSAATFAQRCFMSKAKWKEFRKAYRYIQKRTQWMKYHELKKRHIPIGSGITEAACKTIFAQRLKLSGMRWTFDGAQDILTLRTIYLSGIWTSCFTQLLIDYKNMLPTPYDQQSRNQTRIAA